MAVVVIIMIIIIVIIIIITLCKVFTAMYPQQTMFLGYTELQLVCSYHLWYM
jgi:hypothetical protein